MSQGGANFTILDNVVEIGGSSVSAFGSLETAEMTPVVQLDFVYGINTQTGIATVANSATVDTSSFRLRLQTGTNTAGSAIFQSRNTAKYRPGQGITARFTAAFTAGVASSTQIVGAGTANNGYFFGYNGVTFGILHRNNGSDNWIAQTTWNGDKCDGTGGSGFTWNKANGNVMMIKYPYLGFGNIKFFVQNSTTSKWILVHTIQYTNSSSSVQLSNPNLPFYAQAVNGGNNTNLTMYVGSVGFFLSGLRSHVSNPNWATDNGKSGITAETNIFSIRNATTYNGVNNRGLIRLESLSAQLYAASGNSYGALRLRIGASLGNGPGTYATISGSTSDNGVTITGGNSVASVDTAQTTSTGGTLLFVQALGQGMVFIDLTPFELFVAPSEILTIGGYASASSTIAASLNWSEDI